MLGEGCLQFGIFALYLNVSYFRPWFPVTVRICKAMQLFSTIYLSSTTTDCLSEKFGWGRWGGWIAGLNDLFFHWAAGLPILLGWVISPCIQGSSSKKSSLTYHITLWLVQGWDDFPLSLQSLSMCGWSSFVHHRQTRTSSRYGSCHSSCSPMKSLFLDFSSLSLLWLHCSLDSQKTMVLIFFWSFLVVTTETKFFYIFLQTKWKWKFP